VFRFEVSRSVITVQREFCAQFRTAGSTQKAFSCCDAILETDPAAPRPRGPAAQRPRSKHRKRTAGSALRTWTVAAADGIRFAREG
jgi:hypothetical protein